MPTGSKDFVHETKEPNGQRLGILPEKRFNNLIFFGLHEKLKWSCGFPRKTKGQKHKWRRFTLLEKDKVLKKSKTKRSVLGGI